MLTNPVDSTSGAPAPAPPGPHRAPSHRTGRVIAGGIALAGCVAVGVIDPNRTQLFPTCVFKATTGLDCPGCGMTRGLHALLNGDLLRAMSHNIVLVLLVVGSAIWFGWNAVARRTNRRQLRLAFRRSTWIAIGLAVLAFWVMRNLPWAPLDWLGSDA